MYKTRIELIAAFEPTEKLIQKEIPFLSDKPLLVQSDFKSNDELLEELANDGWELVSTIPNGFLIYGFYKKYIKDALS